MMNIRHLGLQPYLNVWEEMKAFTAARTRDTADECWMLEHLPVYTQGQAGKAQHILNAGNIPVVQSDRGGQVTYHGPGQLVCYLLIDLRRAEKGIRTLVTEIETALIRLLQHYGVEACAKPNAPGVYVDDKKIASLGLRVKQGCTYHGLALNVNMDLTPFNGINPCGYSTLSMIQLSELINPITVADVAAQLEPILQEILT